jgi:hypothetical protein
VGGARTRFEWERKVISDQISAIRKREEWGLGRAMTYGCGGGAEDS